MKWKIRQKWMARYAVVWTALLIVWGLPADAQEINWEGTNGPVGVILSLLTTSDGALYAGTKDSGVYRSADGGDSWTQSGLTDLDVFSLAVSGTDLYAGTWDGVYRSADGGDSWTQSGLPDLFVMSLAISDTALYAATSGSGIFRSTDGGNSWTSINTGLANLTDLFVLSLADYGTILYAGTDGGGVFRSTDGGDSWTAVNIGLTDLEILSLAVSGSTLYAGTDGGGVFRSADGGDSWTATGSGLTNPVVPSLVATGGTLYAGTDGGGVFRSTDGGGSWTEVNAGLTNPVIWSLAASDTTLYAGTDGDGVFRAALTEAMEKTLTITSVETWPGAQITVQISVDNATGIASGDIRIKYDPGVLTVDEVTAADLISGMILVVNKETPGEIGLYMAGATGIPSGSGALVEIGLTVSADAGIGTETSLSFGETRIYDELGMDIPVRLENGVVKITGIKGDVSGDGEVHSNDATLALRIVAQLLIPTDYQRWAADMNDDGAVDANDATLILRKAAGLAAPGRGIIANAGGRVTVMLPEAHGIMGQRVSVPIRVDKADMLASGNICIAYDSAMLRAVGVSSDPDVLMVSNVTEPGIVRIAFASADRLNSHTIARIQFDVLTNSASLLRFRTVELYDPDTRPVHSTSIDREFVPRAMAPEHNALLQNFPNPFNPETWIPFHLASEADVSVRIYDTGGRLVRTLALGLREAGIYVDRERAAYWDGKSDTGEEVASGVYFYTIQAGEFSSTRKMTVGK